MKNSPVLELLKRVLDGFVKVVEHELEHEEAAERAAKKLYNVATDAAINKEVVEAKPKTEKDISGAPPDSKYVGGNKLPKGSRITVNKDLYDALPDDGFPTHMASRRAPKLIDPVSKGGLLLRPIDLELFREKHQDASSVEAYEMKPLSKKDSARGYASEVRITWLGDNVKKLSKGDLLDAPFFTVFECWKGQCQARAVPEEWWVVSGTNDAPGPKQTEILDAMGLNVDNEEPERSDEDTDLGDLGNIFDDLDAALCYLNDGGALIKVPDSMYDDEEHWRLYVVANL